MSPSSPSSEVLELPLCYCSDPTTVREHFHENECSMVRAETKAEDAGAPLSLHHESSPISQLPVEIMSEIFVAALTSSLSTNLETLATTSLPLVVGAVCATWRNIASTTPELWSSFHLVVDFDRTAVQVAWLSEWLLRSGAHLLSISINIRGDDPSRDQPTDIIELLIRHSTRWLSIDLNFPRSWWQILQRASISLSAHDNQLKLPNLKSISLRPSSSVAVLRDESISLEPSCLQEFCTTGLFLHTFDLQHSWEHLLKVTMKDISIDEAFQILRICSNLNTFLVDGLGDDDGEFPMPHVSIVHDKLECLRLQVQESAYTTQLLSSQFLTLVVLPNLRELSLTAEIQRSDWISVIQELVDRSNCPIGTVKLHGPFISQTDMDPLLQSVKTLKSLTSVKIRVHDGDLNPYLRF